MLNKLISNNPADKKLHAIVGIVLSALILVFCFVEVFSVSAMGVSMNYTMSSFAEQNDAGIINTLKLVAMIGSIGSLVLMILPLAGIELKLPNIVTWLPLQIGGVFCALAILLGWIGMMDEVSQAKQFGLKISAGPSLIGWIAVIVGLAACAYGILHQKAPKNNAG